MPTHTCMCLPATSTRSQSRRQESQRAPPLPCRRRPHSQPSASHSVPPRRQPLNDGGACCVREACSKSVPALDSPLSIHAGTTRSRHQRHSRASTLLLITFPPQAASGERDRVRDRAFAGCAATAGRARHASTPVSPAALYHPIPPRTPHRLARSLLPVPAHVPAREKTHYNTPHPHSRPPIRARPAA